MQTTNGGLQHWTASLCQIRYEPGSQGERAFAFCGVLIYVECSRNRFCIGFLPVLARNLDENVLSRFCMSNLFYLCYPRNVKNLTVLPQ